MTVEAEEIKSNLDSQPSWIIHDIKTFQWLRWNNPGLIEKESLGGGNILSLLGLFSVINYLAKVYKILESGKQPTRDPNKDKKLFFTEEQAFKRLAMDYPDEIIQPIQSDANLTKVWTIFRNVLSHTAQIPAGNQALVLIQGATNIPPDILQKYIKESRDKSFTLVSDDGFVCFVDRLVSDVEGMRDWIAQDIDSTFQNKNIKLASEWIKKSTSV